PHGLSFNYTVADNNFAESIGTATLFNNNVQVDSNDFISTALGEMTRFSLHSNDFDANNDPLVISSINDQVFVDGTASTYEKSYDSSLLRHAELVSADTYSTGIYIPLGEGEMTTTTDRAATNTFTLASGISVTVDKYGDGFVDTSAFAARLSEWILTMPTKLESAEVVDSTYSTMIDTTLTESRAASSLIDPKIVDWFASVGLQWDAVANTVTDSFTYRNADGFGGEAGATANITIDISSLTAPTYHDYIPLTDADLTLEKSVQTLLEPTDTWTS
ncbi:MAG: hypothetical protein K8R48_10390, partial [Alphaproteobacteria bacterium]|nr:hypothetical protein [Alphaproteobacteria bacterium]